MKYLLRLALLVMLSLNLACSDVQMPNIPNIFSSSSEVSEVYIGQFPDIPIPRDMSLDSKRTLVSSTPDGVRIGLETYEGRVEQASLAKAMAYNMTSRGWTLKGQIVSTKTIQVFEKDNRIVVTYFYPQTITTAMEIWVISKLQDGIGFNTMPSFEQIIPNTNPAVPPVPSGMQTFSLSQ